MSKLIIQSFVFVVAIATVSFLVWQFPSILPLPISSPTTTPMKIAKYYWPGQYWVEIADNKGWFREALLGVVIVDTNADYFQSLQDVVDGKLDTQDFVLFDLVRHVNDGVDLVAVLAGDRSFGADGIVTKKEIESISDLQGKKVGLPDRTYLDFIFDTVVEQNGSSEKEIIEVDVEAEKAAEEFAKGELSAVVTHEPYLSQAIEKGNGYKIWDTSRLPGISVAVWVFRRDFINEHPDDVQKFVAVWDKTTKFIKSNPDEAFGIIAENYGISIQEVADLATIDKILDRRENITAFSYAAGLESFHGLARTIEDFLRAENLAKKNLDSTSYLDSHFIRSLDR